MTQDQKLDLLLEKFDVMSGQMGSIDSKRRILGYITRKIRELPGFPTLYD